MKLKINQPDYDRLLLYREAGVSRPELGIKDPAKRCRWDCYRAACKIDKAQHEN